MCVLLSTFAMRERGEVVCIDGFWPDGCVGVRVVLPWSFVPSYGKGWDLVERVDGSLFVCNVLAYGAVVFVSMNCLTCGDSVVAATVLSLPPLLWPTWEPSLGKL